ncbi:MAG: tyrosine-type recombinase/integrase [Cyclobacteriaceae bacterium]
MSRIWFFVTGIVTGTVTVKHIIKRQNRYYYNRWVPEEVRTFVPREVLRISLKTDSKSVAERRATILDEHIENYWSELIRTNTPHDQERFNAIVAIARQLGFSYLSREALFQAPIEEIVQRVETLDKQPKRRIFKEALLGSNHESRVLLADVSEIYFRINEDKVISKSALQVRKWKVPRERAITNFINTVGNKALDDLSREDIIAFKNWWIKRIDLEDIAINTANKQLVQVKTMLSSVIDHLGLEIDTNRVLTRITIKDTSRRFRKPLNSEFILKNIVQCSNLNKLNVEARAILFILIETGTRPKELCDLLAEDIILDHDIPHLKIRPQKKNQLKTLYSERDIPLVGYAFEAIKQCPEGFPRYRYKSDNLSATLNKFFKAQGLFMEKDVSLYSLRHSFQDRLTALNAPDRIQCQLMGHKFNRPEYGIGASLGQKRNWLNRVSLKQLN